MWSRQFFALISVLEFPADPKSSGHMVIASGKWQQVRAEVLMRSAFQYHIHSAVFLVLIGCGLGSVRAQTADSQSSDKPWTATTESHTANTNPTRTTESHTKSGNRTVDKQTLA